MRLQEYRPATADANGRAVVIFQPLRSFERWHITLMNIQSTSSVKVPQFRAYRNAEGPSSLVDSTYDGNQNVSNTDITLETGESIIGVWSGADAGSICSMNIQGEILGLR